MVLEEHRRRGIGRRLEVEMCRSFRLDRPEVTTVGADNASGNAPPLGAAQ